MRTTLVILGAMTLWCAAVIPAAGGRASTGLPAPITLQGVGGVTTDMPVEQVQRLWGISLPMLEEWGSSTYYGYSGICVERMAGAAFFVNRTLDVLVFFRGAKTDRNVGIGSTLGDLRAAYGMRLIRIPPPGDFENGPGWRVVAQQGSRPRNAIQFNMRDGRVRAVLYGISDKLSTDYSLGPRLVVNTVVC